jgi:thiol-disulfide isomerase/thioredoxin
MKNNRIIIGVSLIVFVGLLLSFFINRSSNYYGVRSTSNDPNEKYNVQIGSPAPDFELDAIKGAAKLSELRGKVVIINFWATWCGPCAIEMPLFQRFHEAYPEDLVILGINGQDTLEDIHLFEDEFGLTFDLLIDEDNEVHSRYLVRGFPTSVILDRDGIVQINHIGIITEKQLVRFLAEVGL